MDSQEPAPPETTPLIPAEVRELLLPRQLYRENVERMMAMLPADDAVLDAWFTTVLRGSDSSAFYMLAFATAAAERSMDSRHLVQAMPYFRDVDFLTVFTMRATGDVVKHLLESVRVNLMLPSTTAMALCLAVVKHQQTSSGPLPPELIALTKSLARRVMNSKHNNFTNMAICVLCHLSNIAGDTELSEFLTTIAPELKDEKLTELAKTHLEVLIQNATQPILPLIKSFQDTRVATVGTVRRSVEKHSRNELCPCGSGKKYKRCCEASDKDRLRESSPVAGKTVDEVYRSPEEHLTLAKIKTSFGYEIARWDFTKIAPELHEACFKQLAGFLMVDESVAAFEQVGFRTELDDVWATAAWHCMYAWRREPLMRLLALRRAPGLEPEEIHHGVRLLRASDDPKAFLEELQAVAIHALKETDTEYLENITYGLLYSPLSALGIFVARSVIPLVPARHAATILEQLLKTHDQLALPPDDPFADILEKRIAEESRATGHDTHELREARRKLEAKASEVRRLKLDLDRTRQDIERRETKRAARQPAPAQPPKDDADLYALRIKVNALKISLKEHNQERSELRKELHKVHTDLDHLRADTTAKQPAPAPREPQEAGYELPPEVLGAQPVRLITFPARFQSTLDGLPIQIARQAMQTLGRIASGEQAAFTQVVRLKALPGISRVRLGIDFRMLFRLLPQAVEIVDIIPRQDLERRIKTLVAAGA